MDLSVLRIGSLDIAGIALLDSKEVDNERFRRRAWGFLLGIAA
jgi:hypothetical protein